MARITYKLDCYAKKYMKECYAYIKQLKTELESKNSVDFQTVLTEQ